MTFWQKSSEKCDLLSLSAVLGEFSCGDCITCSMGKRNVFLNNLGAKQILFKQIFMQNSNQNTIYPLINLLSDYSKESTYGIPGIINYL